MPGPRSAPSRPLAKAATGRIDLSQAEQPITVLVVGTEDWSTEQAGGSLASAGHRVLRCHDPGEPAFPCNGLIPAKICPLVVGFDVVLAVRSRPGPVPSPGEVGVVCARTRGIPLVAAGVAADSFGAQAAMVVGRHNDVVEACEQAARAPGVGPMPLTSLFCAG